MEAINDCSKLVAKALGLIKEYLVTKNAEEELLLSSAVGSLEIALNKLTDKM